MKAALFIPCLTEHLLPEPGLSMVRILNKLGVEVEYVENQTCCGQPAYNSGYHQQVIPLAEQFIELFHDKEVIIAPSGSCVAMVREEYKHLKLREDLKAPYERLKGRIYEFTEFLVDVLNVDQLGGRFPHRVTYHDSCHLSRMLGVREQPRRLIANIADIDFLEMQGSDVCCGFGGTFSYKMKEISVEMVKRKCDSIQESQAEYCIGADSSCLMNIQGYLTQNGYSARTLHIAELLARSLEL
ncbi:MAG: (Fe-S)-binding protein [candidate division KSB1 bacterium]|nr:(Fe-S)-binding protein [candidate division KSB1 bacterium]